MLRSFSPRLSNKVRTNPGLQVRCVRATLTTTSCSPTDYTCLCADENFMQATEACNAANCTVVETLQATNATYSTCGVAIRDQSATLKGVVASLGFLALAMVFMRLADRAISSITQLGWDDLLIGLSGLISLGMNVPVIVAAHLGFGTDMWGMKPDNITLSLKWLYVAYFMYMIAEALCQLSILAFYLRIMVAPKSRRLVWILLSLVVCFGLANTFSMIFQCTPINFFWNGWQGETSGQCIDVQLFGFIRGGIEIFLDLAILTLPLPMLAGLQMSRKKKLQIMSMFCVGFIITIVSCLRLYSFVQFGNTQNPTYDNTSGLYWCATESNLFTVVACMPAIRGIFHKAFNRVRGVNTETSRNNYGSDGLGKGSYLRQGSGRDLRPGSLPFGVISKSVDVDVHRSQRSDSDIELVDGRPPT
ncbi:CFEM domain-containing protein [Paraphaeosphaeria minitans]|uniref:CFEM domain-containing protein n=1 Tax=Paraphaeosphaeria minitans TaxID=565426 RepID=A0A9P6GDA5_9PLEO|nr:CFEM domain-containing protein [Paraphaeosphaeria minitans]